LGYHLFSCSNQFLLPQEVNLLLYAFSPLLQVRFNIIRNIKNGVCPYAISIYLINIVLTCSVNASIPFVFGTPLPHSHCNAFAIIATILCGILYLQGKLEPFLDLIGYTHRKYAKYMEEIREDLGE
jgi:hypothetical protein